MIPTQPTTRSVPRYLALLYMLCAVGCGHYLDSDYGQRRPPGSVNGTEVLGNLFEAAGHEVSSWLRLTPRLAQTADCIVWFQDDMNGPSVKVREWLEAWLKRSPHRTLIYVGRDYDAAVEYWTTVRRGVTGDEYAELSRHLAEAQNDFQQRRNTQDPQFDAGWFTIDWTPSTRRVNSLQGKPDWTAGVDPAKVAIELTSRVKPKQPAEVLLRDGQDVLVSRQTYRGSQLIVVANGSFLLNLPLANREHRKLATALVNEIGPAPQKIAFLDVPGGNPPIHDKEPSDAEPSMFRYFGLWPLNAILLQIALLGAIFLFCRAPIFGIPQATTGDTLTDFGQHVEAVGALLERTQDQSYAQARLDHLDHLTRHGTADAKQKK